jgi:hypothetical protein
MDPKRSEVDATSNNNVNGESNGNNGGDGMQEQIEHFDAFQIGSMNVQLSPTGTSPFDPILGKKDPPFMQLFHVEKLILNDKICTKFGADSMLRESLSGLYPVGPRGTSLQAANGHRCSAPAALGDLLGQEEWRSLGQSPSAAEARVGGDQHHCWQQTGAHERVGHDVAEVGFSAAHGGQMDASRVSSQKIQEAGVGGSGLQNVVGNDASMIGCRSTAGSSMAVVAVAYGMSQVTQK